MVIEDGIEKKIAANFFLFKVKIVSLKNLHKLLVTKSGNCSILQISYSAWI